MTQEVRVRVRGHSVVWTACPQPPFRGLISRGRFASCSQLPPPQEPVTSFATRTVESNGLHAYFDESVHCLAAEPFQTVSYGESEHHTPRIALLPARLVQSTGRVLNHLLTPWFSARLRSCVWR